jgi:hypothetical protein
MNDIVLLNLRISMWGVSRVLPDHEYEVDADKAMVRATKKILECPEYEFLLQLKRSIHRRLKTLALPGEILRAGVYPVSVPMVEEVEKELEAFSIRWGVGVLALEQVWTCASAKSRTGSAPCTTRRTTPRGSGCAAASRCAGTISA